jgi:hypothetical protein
MLPGGEAAAAGAANYTLGRRQFLGLALAAPFIIRTPGLLRWVAHAEGRASAAEGPT